MQNKTIVLLTDFGLSDGYVGTMEGVIRRIAPSVSVIHLSHLISPQNVRSASYLLWAHYKYFPENTVFLAVVDPGVGTNRSILLAKTKNYYFIAPDNNLLDFVLSEEKDFSLYEVNTSEFSIQKILPKLPVSNTFHGRDLFAPIAAFTAQNPEEVIRKSKYIGNYSPKNFKINFQENKKEYDLELLHSDRFGNLIYNLFFPNFYFSAQFLEISSENKTLQIPFVRSFGHVAPKEPLAYIGSARFLEIAVNRGNASELLKLPEKIHLSFL